MFKLYNGMTVSVKDEIFAVAQEKLIGGLSLFFGIEAKKASDKADITVCKADLEKEEYTLKVSENGVVICASHIRGALYGISTLIQAVNTDLEIADCDITDKPDKAFRGIHMYLPAREDIEQYKRILDVLSFLKLNTVIIETSGAVEYSKHPEINKTWEDFCTLVKYKYPRASSIQWCDTYWKDSVHPEHAGGSYLKKEEVREIVKYAKDMGLELIPEIQALSHSYYLAMSHREIAELPDDPFPDSYCPLNEKSYELYFEVAEEIIELFEPEVVSVGHDEIRIIGQCEKCREKTGHELLAYELNRLHEFYKSKGIRMMMWAEKLQEITYLGEKMAGNAVRKKSNYAFKGFDYYLPATYNAIDMIPNDIIALDWYWALAHESTECFGDRGFTVTYGNFRGSRMYNFNKRIAHPAVIGAEVSTWVTTNEKFFAQDGCFFEFAFSANLLWDTDYDVSQYGEQCGKVNVMMDFVKAIMRAERPILKLDGKLSVLAAPEASEHEFDLAGASCAKSYVKDALTGIADKLYGVPVSTTMFRIQKEFKADGLLIVQNAPKDMKYIPSHTTPNFDPAWEMGTYIVLYEDNTIELINATFGKAVGPAGLDLNNALTAEVTDLAEIDRDSNGTDQKFICPYYESKCGWLASIYYETTPLYDKDTAVFAYEWKNPHPDKTIKMIKAINTCRPDPEQVLKLYGLFAINEK